MNDSKIPSPEVSLVMPMAGKGSRFNTNKNLPKPLIKIDGRPFFWWAAESARRSVLIKDMVFVILAEHRDKHALDQKVYEFYPKAKIILVDTITKGAAETAALGVEAVNANGPVIVNDCDHAFLCPDMSGMAVELCQGLDGGLVCFRADSPAYSYAQLDDHGNVVGTIEKKVVSPWAIAGCYLFANKQIFLKSYQNYRKKCPYNELFISGMYNEMLARGLHVGRMEALSHCSFGIPEELEKLNLPEFRSTYNWS